MGQGVGERCYSGSVAARNPTLPSLERDFSVPVASRHPERTGVLFPGPRLGIESIYAHMNDKRSVGHALADIGSAVNAAKPYSKSDQQTFHSVHVTAAARVARLAREG